ncbi:hypothetical protein AV530_002569 [Patagioenas fasciata monilis]|uniref:Uncharacterized protein n=1 Tax=Patagioenas fasciata monilis TaxID=372326 RepID=A0A1V4K8I2_PATFA|nr:hypothetical protein AV530_002569 [Patagioenas fasciata monilis]
MISRRFVLHVQTSNVRLGDNQEFPRTTQYACRLNTRSLCCYSNLSSLHDQTSSFREAVVKGSLNFVFTVGLDCDFLTDVFYYGLMLMTGRLESFKYVSKLRLQPEELSVLSAENENACASDHTVVNKT